MSLIPRMLGAWLAPSRSGGDGSDAHRMEAQAFEAQVRPHLPGWIEVAMRVMGTLSEAEEVVFQALGNLWLRVQTDRVEDLGAYGARVVMNAARDALRSRRRRARRNAEVLEEGSAEADLSLDPLEEVLGREMREALDAAMERLGDEDRLIVRLHAFESLTFAQVAQRAALAAGQPRNEEWARKRYQRAAQKLREAARRALGTPGS